MNTRCTCAHCEFKQSRFKAEVLMRNELPIISVHSKRLAQIDQAITYLNDALCHHNNAEAELALQHRIDSLIAERIALEVQQHNPSAH